ncbi:8013_t:CDS:2, partial [Dentiscutata erythropus]
LPQNYTYQIQNFNNLPPHKTQENFEVANFELDTFVNVESEKATIHLWLECRQLVLNHSLEVNIKFTHNHVINAAESLSFRPIKDNVCNKLLELFKDSHSPSSAHYTLEDNLHLSALNDQELVELLADRTNNPDYALIYYIFQQYCDTILGSCNRKPMLE